MKNSELIKLIYNPFITSEEIAWLFDLILKQQEPKQELRIDIEFCQEFKPKERGVLI